MGKRTEYLNRKKAELVKCLGGVCKTCGKAGNGLGKLEIHHKKQTISGRGRGKANRILEAVRCPCNVELRHPQCHPRGRKKRGKK